MTRSPLVFIDLETTGLSLDDDIWEIAAIRRDPDGTETVLHLFLFHNVTKCQALPERFRADHKARFDTDTAVLPEQAAQALHDLFTHPHSEVKPHVVGAVPNFDTERLGRLFDRYGLAVPWSHRLRCVETLTAGYLRQEVGGLRDCAEALGIPVDPSCEHTAMGDALTARAIWDRVMTDAR